MPDIGLLIELLEKIGQTSAHVRLEVDYNGREFFWKLPQQNITASEWTPRDLRQRERNSRRISKNVAPS